MYDGLHVKCLSDSQAKLLSLWFLVLFLETVGYVTGEAQQRRKLVPVRVNLEIYSLVPAFYPIFISWLWRCKQVTLQLCHHDGL